MENNLILRRVFSKSIIRSLIKTGNNQTFFKVAQNYVDEPLQKKYSELFNEIYNYISQNYRTEYYYKNVLLNKLLLKKKYYKTTVAFSEFPIAKSKADFVTINGHGRVYEIKTELDNLDRLKMQIDDYYKAFTLVNVVTYEDNISKVEKIIPDFTGILIITKRGALKTIRSAREYTDSLDSDIIFRVLRKNEYEAILVHHLKKLPICDDFHYFQNCCTLFRMINVEVAQRDMLRVLKKRTSITKNELFFQLPESLRFIFYTDNQGKYGLDEVKKMLDRNYGG